MATAVDEELAIALHRNLIGASDAAVIDLTLAYLDELDLLSRAVGEAVRDVFELMPAYERAQLADFIQEVTPMARAGAAEGADLASAYMAELHGAMPAAVDLDLTLPNLEDPFLRHWHDLSEGYSWDHSRSAGAGQADMTGQDAVRGGAAQRSANPGVKTIGWQRVVQPGACEWCQVVATKLYRTKESGAFKGHKGCRCLPPIPVTAENAAAIRKINNARLRGLKKSGAVQRATEGAQRRRARSLGE
jgi:hypothetical protein